MSRDAYGCGLSVLDASLLVAAVVDVVLVLVMDPTLRHPNDRHPEMM
jgi:hypothetical protein